MVGVGSIPPPPPPPPVQEGLTTGKFPEMWKKANALPIHKKDSRQIKNNYRPISSLPICGKIFENFIFDCIYEHLTNNQLITLKQSGFRPGDSTINQLLYITYSIHTAFDEYPSRETIAVFPEISKTLYKVWHKSLIFKLKK